ncbi:hypothetical protein [Pseudomonas putida]|uniref:hypothetical protein n=1 Tax=Pseudomonas putida TaxID=303 RepID=UPI002366B2E0|nr:hypothetical protein [Pseudomonas putida]MDD2048974.1 hypothetical protein [Pseudomonas putida]
MTDNKERSFIARLYVRQDGYDERVGITVSSTPSYSGWLKSMKGNDTHVKPVNFRFDFLEGSVSGVGERLIYNISCSSATAGYRGAKLGESISGYAGLYQVANVENFWKAEPFNRWEDDQDLQFGVRNHKGMKLRSYSSLATGNEVLMNTHDGEVLTFKAQVLKWL